MTVISVVRAHFFLCEYHQIGLTSKTFHKTRLKLLSEVRER